MNRRWIRQAAIATARRPLAFLAASCLVGVVAFLGARDLRFETDLAGALPAGSPAAEGYRTFAERFAAAERAFVVLRPQEGTTVAPDDLATAAGILAEHLSGRPEISWARAGLDADDEDFLLRELAPRLPLLLGDDARATILSRTGSAGATETARRIRETLMSPVGPVLAPVLAADPLGLSSEGLRGASAGGSLPLDEATGAFLSEDLQAALVVIRPSSSEVDPDAGEALHAALEASYESTRNATSLALRFDAVGGPLYAYHDALAIRGDLVKILGAAGIFVSILIFLAFGGPTIPAVALVAVALGQLWTAGLVGWRLGTLSAVGAGFAAILLGLGDDFSIHLGARFRELRVRGLGPGASLARTFTQTGPGIFSAATATVAAFACLAFARFPPLRELGVVVALGVVALSISTFTVAAPLLVVADRSMGRRSEGRAWKGFGRALEVLVGLGTRRTKLTLVVACGLTLLGAVGISFLRFDPDLARLRPEDPPSKNVEEIVASSFGLGVDTATVVVPGAGLDEALEGAREVASLLRRLVGGKAEVTSPSDWFVSREETERAAAALAGPELADAADRLEAALDQEGLRIAGFSTFLEGLRALSRGEVPEEIPWEDWPDWLRDAVRVDDAGAAVAVRVRLPRDLWPEGPSDAMMRQIELAAPGASVASAARLGRELRALAVGDVLRLGGLAVAVVTILVFASYRGKFLESALTLLPVACGSIWTFGLWGWFDLPFDLFSASALPVMMGIGVDDGLHVLHLSRAARTRTLGEAALSAGRGVVLTNLTTCAGFGALLLSSVPSLRAAGGFVCVGNLACLVAALVVLPALGQSLVRR